MDCLIEMGAPRSRSPFAKIAMCIDYVPSAAQGQAEMIPSKYTMYERHLPKDRNLFNDLSNRFVWCL